MNNSLERMIEGLVSTMREEVIPHIDTEFARGQAFGVIYMLNSIQERASWSQEFVGEQLAAQQELLKKLSPLLSGLDAPPLPEKRSVTDADISSATLESLRDDNESRICALIEWHGTANLDKDRRDAIEQQFRIYMDRQLKHELKTSAKPMFAEMSSGTE